MDWTNLRGRLLDAMKSLNLIILVYISMLLFATASKIASSGNARAFLEAVRRLPVQPWKIPAVTILSFCVLLGCMSWKEDQGTAPRTKVILIAAEWALGVVIIGMLNFSYNGILFLIMADLMAYFRDYRDKLTVTLVLCLLFLVLDYDVCGRFFGLIAFADYLDYYQGFARSAMLGGRNLLESLNTICFIAYTVILLREESFERRRVQVLNEKLNEANAELQRANKELEQYADEKAAMAQTRERNRLAREIHDTLGHTLTGIIAGVDACMALINVDRDATRKQMEVIGKVARQGMKDVRRSVNALRPDVLEQGTLLDAVMTMMEEISLTSNAKIILENRIEKLKFNEDEEDTIYRIVQESVTNAIRHGKATKVVVTMEQEYCMVTIRIRDNGVGAGKIVPGFGLQHMRERLELLKGELEVDGSDGFTVTASIPIRWGEE